jgi:lysophospholipase L1-like esterase
MAARWTIPTSETRRDRTPKRRLALVALLLGTAVVLVETGLWLARPVAHPYRGAPPVFTWNRYAAEERDVPRERTLHFRSELYPGIQFPIHYTLNAFGYRSPRLQSVAKPAGTRRVFCLGGSLTNPSVLDDADTWPEVLCHLLQKDGHTGTDIDVINAGNSSQATTRDLVAQLSQRVVPFAPDVVVCLPSWADTPVLLKPDYDILRRDEWSRVTVASPEPAAPGLFITLADFSQLFRRLVWYRRSLAAADRAARSQREQEGRWIEDERRRLAVLPRDGHLPPNVDLTEFRQNLTTFVSICKGHRCVCVLITAPTALRAGISATEERWLVGIDYQGKRVAPEEWRSLIDRFNAVVSEVAAREGCVLVDLEPVISDHPENFYDGSHLNILGSHRTAELVAEALRREPAVRERLGFVAKENGR